MAPFRLFLLAAGLGAALVALLWGAVAGATPTIHVAGKAVAKRAQTGGLTPGGVPFPPNCRIPKSLLTGRSRAIGRPGHGRLVNGVPLPEESDYWFTWNFPGGFSPNPEFRRYGTEKLILTLECVLTQYGMRHPELARIGVADVALTHGGPFYGKKYGGLGHGSHQNGLDADVLMPRKDLCECAPQSPSDVDAARAQELVDAFAAAGAQYEFVSPVLYRRGLLHGKRGQVIPLQFHDDHIHVRIRP